MLHRLWLLFAQSVTVLLAIWLVLATFKPAWLGGAQINSFVEKVSLRESLNDGRLSPRSYREAFKHSMPVLVDTITSIAECPIIEE